VVLNTATLTSEFPMMINFYRWYFFLKIKIWTYFMNILKHSWKSKDTKDLFKWVKVLGTASLIELLWNVITNYHYWGEYRSVTCLYYHNLML
jgi:hypothetical protein